MPRGPLSFPDPRTTIMRNTTSPIGPGSQLMDGLRHRIRLPLFTTLLLCVLASTSGCATGRPASQDAGTFRPAAEATASDPGPLPEGARLVQTGTASWYGGKFHGRPTASGEIFNKWDRTAAHRTLPLGTRVLVAHRRTGRRVRVRINDRGPFVKGRIIDLARGAAARLNMVRDGTAPVRLYVLGGDTGAEKPVRTPSEEGVYTIQVGSFRNRSNARRLHDRLARDFDHVSVTTAYDRYHRVRVGEFESRSEAEDTLRRLRDRGLETWTVFKSR